MAVFIKHTDKEDYFITEYVTRDAFWDQKPAGSTEHFALHKLRKSDRFVKELDFIAIESEIIVGHVLLAKACLIDCYGNKSEALSLDFLSVLTDYQNKSIGTLLVQHALNEAESLGYGAVFVSEMPLFFRRFGFRNADCFGMNAIVQGASKHLMAFELKYNSLRNASELLVNEDMCSIDNADFERFDAKFPYRHRQTLSA
jgi:predicted N-acetyltransferase YhbS